MGDAAHDIEIYNSLDSPLQLTPPPLPFSPGSVLNLINTLPNKKAPGYDLITAEVLKQLPRKGVVFLTYIYNSILRTTYFPLQWKFSVIIALPKPGKPSHRADSNRPISLLPLCSKLFEKLLFQRIAPFLDSALPSHQFGFRSAHSTVHQLHRVVDYIAPGLESKCYINAAFLDVAQAFDRVWHDGLLYKLKESLPFTYYLILKSFLSFRYFSVRENNTFSSIYPVRAGVPQGSVIAPRLYNHYTADKPTKPRTLTAAFADDEAILSRSQSLDNATHTLQEHLTELSHWFNVWKIKINPTKCVNVTFSLRPGICPPVYLSNSPLPQSDSVKYLGVTLDRRLTWAKHIQMKRQTITSRTKLLYGLIGRQSSLPLSRKLTIYKYFLKPIWSYACPIYGTAKPSNLSRLQTAQSKILRTITNSPWYVRNETLHNDLQVPYLIDAIKQCYERFHRKTRRHKNELIRLINKQHLPGNPIRRLKRTWNRDLLR